MSEAVVHNGTIYLAGQVAEDPSQDVAGQTRQILEAIDRLLGECGSDKTRILSGPDRSWLTSPTSRRVERGLGRLGTCRPHPGSRDGRVEARRAEVPGRDQGRRGRL